MKIYKIQFTDGKSIKVKSTEKITVKKLSPGFLTVNVDYDNIGRIFINTNYILLVEEQKQEKPVNKKKVRETAEKKAPATE